MRDVRKRQRELTPALCHLGITLTYRQPCPLACTLSPERISALPPRRSHEPRLLVAGVRVRRKLGTPEHAARAVHEVLRLELVVARTPVQEGGDEGASPPR